MSDITSLGPSNLAWFGIILSALILVAGMILSRNDISTLKRGGLRNRGRDFHQLALPASGNFSFIQAMTYILDEIAYCQNAGATVAAAAMIYIGIDVMVFLSMPAEQATFGENDFKTWVDMYLQDDGHGYKFRGESVYAARCFILDMLSPVPNHSGNLRRPVAPADPKKEPNSPISNWSDAKGALRAVIRAADFERALDNFVSAWDADEDLRTRGASRLPAVYELFRVANGPR